MAGPDKKRRPSDKSRRKYVKPLLIAHGSLVAAATKSWAARKL